MKFLKNQNGISKVNLLTFFTLIIGATISMPIIFILIETIKINNFNILSIFSEYLIETVQLVVYTCILSIILAIIPAWIITFYKIKFQNIFELLLILPLAIPGYIMAFTYSDILGFNGYFDVFLQTYFKKKIEKNPLLQNNMPKTRILPYLFQIKSNRSHMS